MQIKRGDIYYADLSPVIGSEQGGLRPVVVVQNDVGNKYSPTIIAAAITSQRDKTELPTHIRVAAEGSGLQRDQPAIISALMTPGACRSSRKRSSGWKERSVVSAEIVTTAQPLVGTMELMVIILALVSAKRVSRLDKTPGPSCSRS